MVLVTEIGDLWHFEDLGRLMAYVGLAPTEHSSGGSRWQGSITKAGNSRVRHVLVHAAWSYRFPPRRGLGLECQQEGQRPEIVTHSWKVQHRLHKVFRRLALRKSSQIVVVARELAGFVWAIMQATAVQAGTRRQAARKVIRRGPNHRCLRGEGSSEARQQNARDNYVAGARPTHLEIEPALDESEFLPLWPRANRRISGGFAVEANLRRPLPSTHATSLRTRWPMPSQQSSGEAGSP